jgi:Transcription factor WhiB
VTTATDPRRAWVDGALCAQTDPEIFFPLKGAPGHEAKRICAQCPVRLPCLEEALARDLTWGIWGGLTPRERKKERDRRAERGAADADRDRAARQGEDPSGPGVASVRRSNRSHS